MAEEPLVSVLMSNYNYGRYVGEAIGSVLRQTYAKLELVVCDDGSSDRSCNVIEWYKQRDHRVTMIRKANGGQASGYNAAFRASHGDVICFLDADDVCLPTKLERVVEGFRANPEAGFAGHKLIRVDERRRRIGISPLLAQMPTGWQGDYMLRNAGFLEYLAPGGGLSLRREIAARIFPLPETGPLSHYGDGPLMRLAPLMTNLIALDEGLAEWRCHGSNFSNRQVITADYLRRELDIYEEFWRLQRSYLERHYPIDIAASLAPLETNPHVAQMDYMLARLENAHVLSTWREVMRRRRTTNRTDEYLRWFWPLSIILPRHVFSILINLLLGPNNLKSAFARLMPSTAPKTSHQHQE
jgi:glycosyltransferase involved in cell wall biosynthesis